MPNEVRKAMKETRLAHRNCLRAAAASDPTWMRAELYSLYNPQSTPLRHLMSGPEPISLVPLVDAALLTSYKNLPLKDELMDNLRSVSNSFGMRASDLRHVELAVREAANVARDPDALQRMSHHLEQTSFKMGAGLTMPSAMSEMS